MRGEVFSFSGNSDQLRDDGIDEGAAELGEAEAGFTEAQGTPLPWGQALVPWGQV